MSLRSRSARKSARGGFTLIEVMIAVSILAVSLSVVFGNSIFALKEALHANKLNRAAGLARCAMTELEADIAKKGFTEDDEEIDEIGGSDEDNNCCKGTEFTCSAKIEIVKLPDPSAPSGDKKDSLGGSGSLAGGGPLGGGSLGQFSSALGQMGNGAGGAGPLSGAGMPNINKVMGDLLVMLYPTIKPMYESAIRKVTLRVAWREGNADKHVDVVQYIVQPQRSFGPGL